MPSHTDLLVSCARSVGRSISVVANGMSAMAKNFMTPPGRASSTLTHIILSVLRSRAHLARRQRERDVLARVVAAADRHDEVLTAVLALVRHRRPALRRRHPHRADFLSRLLV